MRKSYLLVIFILCISVSILGFFMLFNPSKSLTSVTLIIGLLFLLNGVNEVLGYISQAKIWNISRWHLIEGVFSVLIGMATFFYTNFAEQIFVFMFALWMLFSAISHIFISRTLKGLPGTNLILLLVIIMLILGVLSFFTQSIAAITVAIIIGVFFIAQGFIWISLGLVIRRLN